MGLQLVIASLGVQEDVFLGSGECTEGQKRPSWVTILAPRSKAQSMWNSRKLARLAIMRAEFWKRYAEISINDRQCKRLNKLLDACPDRFEGGLSIPKDSSTRDPGLTVDAGMLAQGVRYDIN